MKQAFTDIHKDIVEQCKNGVPKAQYELYRLYSRAMYNTCFRLLNNKEDAEDMLQEVFTYAFRKLSGFRYESSFGAWLKQIAVNTCINKLKKRKAELSFVEDIEKYDEPEEEKDEKNIQYEVQKVINAVEQLPEGFRIVFSLYLLEGYDHTEISQILGISESTSKTQFLRAKKKIKELLT
ncbi:MAG: RNA polymerase sigma factor [Bacteroidales bacterium]|nr:RNA polymerase sigma factor [Bacteroidales bacterium]